MKWTSAVVLSVLAAGCGGSDKKDEAAARPEWSAVLEFRASESGGKGIAKLSEQGTDAMPMLLFMMTGNDTAEAMEAAEAAARIGKGAIPALVDLLRSSVPKGRGWAAWALGEMGPAAQEAKGDLEEAAKTPELRTAATEALGKIGK